MKYSKSDCEFLRNQQKEKFQKIRGTWCDQLRWAQPHRATWILSQTEGERKNQHIVDPTHTLALRSYVAGFLEGNTSASRPWARIGTKDSERDDSFENKMWLQHFTERVMHQIGSSNFYHAAGNFYYDYGSVNTGTHYFEIRRNGKVHVHTLTPGSYFVLNNAYGEAISLTREVSLNVKSIVDTYKKVKKDGSPDWSNISHNVKKMYDDGNFGHMVDIVHQIKENPHYDPENPDQLGNRKWLELTYELGRGSGHFWSEGQEYGSSIDTREAEVYLREFTTKRKPFVVGKSTDSFEYGEKGPTTDSMGLIKSLNKKAIGKDQALEQMLRPALQGPANLRKSYISHAPNTFVPLDAKSVAAGGKLESIFNINPAIGSLIQDVSDMRQQVDKLYYADFLLYLSKNPKTRTATETDAIMEEQQRIIGPNLQSLNTTYNIPVLEWFMDFTLFEDPYLKPPPSGMEGQALKPEFISVFAQAQKAADLPAIDRYVQMVASVAQIDPKILQKLNTDKLADLYEDRLYLPAGLNNEQSKVDAERQQAAMQEAQRRKMEETMPAMAGAAKDMASAKQMQSK